MDIQSSRSFIITLFLLSLFFRPFLCIGSETSLTLVYSSNTSGEIEPIWRGQIGYSGGLARRSNYIRGVREEVKNLLVLDGGDALAKSYSSEKVQKTKDRKKAEIILEAYERMGYDAINIGDLDLGLDIKHLRYLQNQPNIPFLSSNLVYGGTKKPVFKPHLIKKIGGLSFGIIGLLPAELPIHMHKELKGYFIKDPFQTATTVLSYLMTQCDYLIVLAHLTLPHIESLIELFPKISVIIGGEGRSFTISKEIFGSLVVQTDAFGVHIGRLNLKLSKRFTDHLNFFPTTLLQKNITRYENILTLLHPGMESDLEIEKVIESSRD